MTPFGVKNTITGETIPVPCGKCPECVSRRVSQWSFRLMQEERRSSSAVFITLTYSTTTVPITTAGYMTLTKTAIQLFMKRLRKAHPKEWPKIVYYAVGEYGGKTMRPHYHMLLYNADIKLIAKAWTDGHVHYGKVSGASIGYCLKYMSKKGKIPMHRNDDREPEFALMSKGIGESYLKDDMVAWHIVRGHERMYCCLQDGRKISMPRYYKDKIFSDRYFESAEQAMYVRKRVAYFALQKIIEEQKIAMSKDPNYFRNKAERDKQAFRIMERNYNNNQKL